MFQIVVSSNWWFMIEFINVGDSFHFRFQSKFKSIQMAVTLAKFYSKHSLFTIGFRQLNKLRYFKHCFFGEGGGKLKFWLRLNFSNEFFINIEPAIQPQPYGRNFFIIYFKRLKRIFRTRIIIYWLKYYEIFMFSIHYYYYYSNCTL